MAEGGTQEERSRNAGAEAVETGLRSGLLALGVSSVCVGLANQFWPGFRNGLNVSGKTALVVTPFFFYFFLDAEHKLNDLRKKNYARMRSKDHP
ncbi:hypothetical protein HOP50_15g73970 [Chloropicon primus]|uniref:Uncharacterized protein n=1 Tax=Chloropicon primus TaxID=1764295 RepID=A0A5B8MZK8_9CHLO|nr:hypothetical protein A3770_15p73720 [Chloropicon primus]UPR04064.1 hypothetical protein HOP50_15g73970 [Chloropicon primus]|mmetsp:Transcript_14172/g.40168  ORF Transcript_14172/g.40168 Transcript_14172/m.40168 type:complete len:94 (-) Transcript_14172:250-531(-)|eukprot:QDZ24854.1 hypothetical protein A3770_15p73720 [Chloropicon primus]